MIPAFEPVSLVLFAVPAVLVYMVGAGLVLFINDRNSEQSKELPAYVYKPDTVAADTPPVVREKLAPASVATPARVARPAPSEPVTPEQVPKPHTAPVREMDFVSRPTAARPTPIRVQPAPRVERSAPAAPKPIQRVYQSRPVASQINRSIDGLLPQRG
jgi:hypothetical protein